MAVANVAMIPVVLGLPRTEFCLNSLNVGGGSTVFNLVHFNPSRYRYIYHEP